MTTLYMGIYNEMFSGASFFINENGRKCIKYNRGGWDALTQLAEDIFYKRHAIFKDYSNV